MRILWLIAAGWDGKWGGEGGKPTYETINVI